MPPLEVHESLETGMKRSLRFPPLFGVSRMAHPSMAIRRKMFLVPISSISSHHWRNTFFGAFGVDSIWMPLEKSLVHYFLCHCPRVLSYCLQRKQGILFFSVKIGLIERRIYEHIAPERKKFIAILTQCRKAESRIFELYGTCNSRRSLVEDRSGFLVRVILQIKSLKN